MNEQSTPLTKHIGLLSRSAFKKHESDQHKILFLLPPNIEFDDFVSPPANISTIEKNGLQFGSVITDIPLGVISLSAYLKDYLSIDSKCIDFNVELNRASSFEYGSFFEYFKDRCLDIIDENFKPDYVAISSLFTPAYQSIIDLANVARILYPESMILVGGNLPTSMYHEILSDSVEVDAICFGEGEKAFLDLIKSGSKHNYLNTSSSWVTHEKVESGDCNLTHDFIWDLDEIPFLDYDMLDIEGYKLNPTSSRYSVADKYETSDFEELEATAGKDVADEHVDFHSMPIMTSRGCPFKCTFCASHAAHGRSMRYHSTQRVLEDTKKMVVPGT